MESVVVYISNVILIKKCPLLHKIETAFKIAFTRENPKYGNGNSSRDVEPYVILYAERSDRFFLPRGCLEDVEKFFLEHKIQPVFKEHGLVDTPCEIFFPKQLTLKEDQSEALSLAVQSSYGGILLGATSFGKCLLGLAVIQSLGMIGGIIVWADTHQKAWLDEIKKWGFISPEDIGGVGGYFEKPKLGKINICMQQSLFADSQRGLGEVFKLFNESVGCWILDEGQRAAAPTFVSLLNLLKSRYRFTVTASHERRDGLYFIIEALFGRVLYDGSKNVDTKSKIPALINLVTSDYTDDAYIFNKNHSDLLDRLSLDKDRNALIVSRAMRKVKERKLVLILVERKIQAIILLKMFSKDVRVRFVVGNFNEDYSKHSFLTPKDLQLIRLYDAKKEFEEVQELARDKLIDVVIGTQKAYVGMSIKTFEHEIVTTPSGNNLELFNQKVGRVERSYYKDEYLLEKFGEKPTPTVDYIADIEVEPLKVQAQNIFKYYPRKVRWINGQKYDHKSINKQRKVIGYRCSMGKQIPIYAKY